MKAKVTLKNYLTLPDGVYTVAPNIVYVVRGASKRFLLRYRLAGKRYDKALGSARFVTLTQAKEEGKKLLAELALGAPLIKTKKELLVEEYKEAEVPTVKAFCLDTVEKLKRVRCWRNKKTYTNMRSSLETYVYPVIGQKKITEVTRDDVLKILEPIWTTKNETAQKLRGRLESILSYAVTEGHLMYNVATWRGNLDQYLPPPSKVQVVRHYPSMPLAELQEKLCCFLPANNRTRRLILFTILTASRVGASTGARWDEFDFEERIWYVPPERRKDGKPYPHRVPLSDQAVELLNSIERTNEYVFSVADSLGSRYSLNVLLKRMTGSTATMHGFRSTFRDWAAENEINDGVAEKCLMHSVGNAVVQAYQRSDLLELRRPVMQAWADAVFALQFTGEG